jgi:N-acetylmuramoyl-L-alanine amidase
MVSKALGTFVPLVSIIFNLNPSVNAAAAKPFTVVIDPGHGGTDQGATYSVGGLEYKEKDLTLLLSKQIARQLNAQRISAQLTRNDDKDVPLQDRTAMANRLKADLFLSVHLNSTIDANPSAHGHGVETYFLSTSTNDSSKRLADLENSVLKGSIANPYQQEGSVGLILKDLILQGNLSGSKRLANLIQTKVVNATSTPINRAQRNRGVKQALFYVLLGADMPSILLEAGFLQNPTDRNWVATLPGRQKMGKAVVDAILEFKKTNGAHSDLSLNGY